MSDPNGLGMQFPRALPWRQAASGTCYGAMGCLEVHFQGEVGSGHIRPPAQVVTREPQAGSLSPAATALGRPVGADEPWDRMPIA